MRLSNAIALVQTMKAILVPFDVLKQEICWNVIVYQTQLNWRFNYFDFMVL